MDAILLPLGLYGGNRKSKIPSLAIFVFTPSDGCPTTANLLSLDASLAILTLVLRFEVSGLRRRTPVKPVLLTGQTGTHGSDWSDPNLKTGQTHQLDRSDAAASLSSVLWSWLCGSTKNLVVFW
jgi:hypothetical protein